VVRNHAKTFPNTKRLEFVFVNCTVVEIIQRLETFISRKTQTPAHVQSLCKPVGGIVGSADDPHLSLINQLTESLESLFERRLWIILVRLIEIDVVSLQPAKRILGSTLNVLFRE